MKIRYIGLLFFIIIMSCNSSSLNFSKILSGMYGENIVVKKQNIYTVYLTENRIQIINNILLMNKLYAESDSLLKLKIKYLENDQLSVISQIKQEQLTLHNDMIKTKEELKSRLKGYMEKRKDSKKYHFIFFFRENQKKEKTILLNDKFEIVLNEY